MRRVRFPHRGTSWALCTLSSIALAGASASVVAACGSSASPGDGNRPDGSPMGDACTNCETGAAFTDAEAGANLLPEAGMQDSGPDADVTVEAGADGTTETDADAQPESGADAGADVNVGPVTFSVDLTKGPARQYGPPPSPVPISNYVYGINATGSMVASPRKWGLVRQGGNNFTDYNWTNNYVNVGASLCYGQEQDPGGAALAGVITQTGDSIPAAQAKGEAVLATVSLVDYVPAAVANVTASVCPAIISNCGTAGGTTSTTQVNVNSATFSFASETDGGSPDFVRNLLVKPGAAYCTCAAGAACTAPNCAVSAAPVYEDELVNYLRSAYGAGGAPIFFSLDNEPNYWGDQHPEVWPHVGTVPCKTYSVSYDDIVSRDLAAAKAVKAAWPNTKVFGPVVAQDGMIYAHSYDKDPHASREFLDYYLSQMAAAAPSDAGAPLLDALDVHYYNRGKDDPLQCVQSPRMFWDPNYTDISPLETDKLDFQYSGQVNNYFDVNWYPRQVIPRLLGKIAAAYAGLSGAPGLSFSEYNNGCEDVVAGGVAEADVLGVFGREGVYAAMAKVVDPALANNYLVAAFDLYRNYDGSGAMVGDVAAMATTSDVKNTSVYAFTHSGDPTAVDLVAINKSTLPTAVTVTIANAPALTQSALYSLTGGAAAVVKASSAPTVTCAAGTCSIAMNLAPLSASTIVLRP